jgi:hypothetical protein
MKSDDIVKLLKEKHAEDVFVPECIDGPTHHSSYRLDAWAMAKSWARPVTYGYEIKVSKSDFRNDTKWQNYLGYCSDFYFVCPWELIQPEEVAAPAGLMWVAKTGTRLWVKRKAARRQVEIPEIFWRSVVMQLDKKNPYASNAEFWTAWAASKEQTLDVGHRVSRRLRELISERITKVLCENNLLKRQNESLQEAKQIMDKLGVHYSYAHQFEQDLKERTQAAFDPELAYALKNVRDSIDNLLKKNPNEAAAKTA